MLSHSHRCDDYPEIMLLPPDIKNSGSAGNNPISVMRNEPADLYHIRASIAWTFAMVVTARFVVLLTNTCFSLLNL